MWKSICVASSKNKNRIRFIKLIFDIENSFNIFTDWLLQICIESERKNGFWWHHREYVLCFFPDQGWLNWIENKRARSPDYWFELKDEEKLKFILIVKISREEREQQIQRNEFDTTQVIGRLDYSTWKKLVQKLGITVRIENEYIISINYLLGGIHYSQDSGEARPYGRKWARIKHCQFHYSIHQIIFWISFINFSQFVE